MKQDSYLDQIKRANFNLDANQMGFLARQLEMVETQMLQIAYPALKATQLIPVQTFSGAQQWAETATYRQWDQIGKARIISDWADDFKQVGVNAIEVSGKFVEEGASYQYNYKEIQQAQLAGYNLSTELAAAGKHAIDQAIDDVAWFGAVTSGITGFLNNPDVPRSDVPNDGDGASTLWTTKIGDQIWRDMTNAISDVNTISNGVETADTLLLPLAQYNYIGNIIYNTYSSESILTVFKRENPGILVDSLLQLKGAGTAGVDVMVAYARNPQKVVYRLPIPFMQFPVQSNGTVFNVKMLCRMGDVVFRFPKSANIKEGI